MKKNKDSILIIKMIVTMAVVFAAVLWILIYVLNGNVGDNAKVNVDVGKFPELDVYTTEEALNTLTPTKVKISNDTNGSTSYELYFTVDKNSTLDYKFLRVKFDGEIYDLSNTYYYDLGSKLYFEVKTGDLKKRESKEFDAYIWIDSTYTDSRDNKTIYVDFDTLN